MKRVPHKVTIPLEGGYLVFQVPTDDEDEAIQKAMESLGQAPNLMLYDLAFDAGLAIIEPLLKPPSAS